MTHADAGLPDGAAALRQAFDRSFAAAPADRDAAFDDFLAIRLNADAHALPLADVARLLPMPRLTRFPSAMSAWLGVAGIGGAVVPVYDLRALLGYAATAAPRWMVIAAAAPLGLAFDAFEGQFRHLRDADAAAQHRVLRTVGAPRSVVPMSAVLADITSRIQEHR